ncbi:MAG: aldehyde ferredoxin oxidoreductase family protein [Dehalococcoidia bacterium]|nr:MAG: aldehyde ferredoxin oxidoreductase family protein [Dehalococcoidia bacterium]
MGIKSGYFKIHLHVDLSQGNVEQRALSDAFLEKYIGGRGFGAKLVWDNLKKRNFRIDPLGPDNLLVIAPGPLTGAYLPSSGKNSFVAISPATGLYGDSSIGGSFGVELRQAGVDVLSIEGKAPELSVIFIDNGETSIVSVPNLKGKSCLEAERMIKERLGIDDIHVAIIGLAGENMVKFACVNTDWGRNAGRTGIGAIMGSKNLKAIAVRGDKDLPVHDIKGLVAENDKASEYMRNHSDFRMWQQQGLMQVIDYAHGKGILPTYNFKDSVFDKHDQINGDTMLSGGYKIGDSACFSCPMCCSNICAVKTGKYAGTAVEGPEYESCAMLGSNLGIENFAAVITANQLCDELGVDTISAGSIVGAVIEGYEQGVISLNDLDGKEIGWGDEEAILGLIKRIAHREGIGDILADGAYRIIERWPEMDKILLHVRGLEQSAYDSRPSLTMALAYATSDIGAHHTRAWTIAKELSAGQDWTDDEKVDHVIYHQKLRPLFDMLGVCRLPWIELGLSEWHYENFYKYITGNEATLEQLLELSNDIYDLTRLINARLGSTGKDDTLPYKVWARPPQTGPSAGKAIDQEAFLKLRSLYYQRRGWNEDGLPPTGLEKKFDD